MEENESVKLVRFLIEGNFCNCMFFYSSCLFSCLVVY